MFVFASIGSMDAQSTIGPKQYYLSLGDSLARGYQPNGDMSNGFADQFAVYLQANGVPNYVNYGCSAETSTTFINGLCPYWYQVRDSYGTTPQLTAALNFINAHPGQVSPVTLDMGGNDALNDIDSSTCVVASTWPSDLTGIDTRLRSIISQLKTALNGTGDLFVMNYYNPYANQCGSAVATVMAQLNSTIQNAALTYGVPVTDVLGVFGGLATPNPFLSTYTWITTQNNIHPNTTGYGVIANAFEFTACYGPAGDYCFMVDPANQQTVPGSSNTYTLNLNPAHGFSGSVSFSSFSAGSGVTATLPAPVALTGPASATMTVALSAASPTGTYPFTLTSQSGSLKHTAGSEMTGVASQYSISVTPPSATVIAGSSATYTVTITPLPTFSGAVTVSLLNPPAGVSAVPVTVTAGSSGSFLVTTTSGTVPGTYTLTISTVPVNGAATQNSTMQLTVQPPPDYTLSVTPGSVVVTAGSNAVYTVAVTPIAGFSSTVGVSLTTAPTGVSAAPITVAPGTSQHLTVATKACTAGGSYGLGITGTVSGGPTHTANMNLLVAPAANPIFYWVASGLPANTSAAFAGTPPSVKGDFSLSASPGSVTLSRGSSVFLGLTDTATNGSGSSTSPVKISAASTAPTGSYFVVFEGASCSYKHSTAILLTIK